jgi:hypothetical protein
MGPATIRGTASTNKTAGLNPANRLGGTPMKLVIAALSVVMACLLAGPATAARCSDCPLFVAANGPVVFAPEVEKRDAYKWRRDFIPITSISMTPLLG